MKPKLPIRTVIVDDEPIALDKLAAYVEKVPFLQLTARCAEAFEAMRYMAENEVDLVITDINMPDLNGLEFVESLAEAPMVIFTTAHSQYAVESYRLAAVDYLLKPYRFTDFQRAVNRALAIFNARYGAPDGSDSSIFVKVDSRFVRVALDDILYIKGYGEYLQIYVADSPRPLLTLSSFAAILERLSDAFVQVHRSYIVNMNRVAQIDRNRITVAEDIIPVGDSYKAAVQHYVQSHSVGSHTNKIANR